MTRLTICEQWQKGCDRLCWWLHHHIPRNDGLRKRFLQWLTDEMDVPGFPFRTVCYQSRRWFRLLGQILVHRGRRHIFETTFVERPPFSFLRLVCTRCGHRVLLDDYIKNCGIMFGCEVDEPRDEWL